MGLLTLQSMLLQDCLIRTHHNILLLLPGLHFGDIHVLTATYIDGLEKVVGNSKYAIFFPTSGSRSLADEMANSDFDGDIYWVSKNPFSCSLQEPVCFSQAQSPPSPFLLSHSGKVNLELGNDSLLALKHMSSNTILRKESANQMAMFVPCSLPYPALLEQFQKSDPWVQRSELKNDVQNKPADYDVSELEGLLFSEFLRARFTPSCVLRTATDCWLALMDRLLTENVPEGEQKMVTKAMLELVDIYYLALDAPKEGNKVGVPSRLKVKQYPHFMEQANYPSYHSTSVLGRLYDEVKRQEDETVSPISIS